MKVTQGPVPISLLYLLLATLTLGFAASVPKPQSPPKPQTSGTTSPSLIEAHKVGEAHCVAGIPLLPWYLRLHHCIDAIRTLSNDDQNGVFHLGDPDDGFSLPISRTRGFCEVKIEINRASGAETARGSWTQVRQEATLLNAQCQSRYGYRYRGGWILMGAEYELKISLRWPGTQLLSANDTTVSDVTLTPNPPALGSSWS